MKSVMICNEPKNPIRVYSETTLAQLKEIAELAPGSYTKEQVLTQPELFADTEFIFSTWGMPAFTEEEIRSIFPKLRGVFYGAGTVQGFAREFLNCGVPVFSAWAANGVPVAEYTVAQIVLANKGFFATCGLRSVAQRREVHSVFVNYPGNFDEKVGIIGAGMIGKMVIRKLKDYNLEVKVFDPFLPDEKAKELSVEKCSLEELFATCNVVSNHLANNPQTVGMLDGKLFASMRPYATFINTGRGAQVVEDDLVKTLQERPDLMALLDVTFPEPPVDGHPFYELPNCILTPHIAGSSGNEVHRMAEYMAQEYQDFVAGKQCKYSVSLKMLETMA